MRERARTAERRKTLKRRARCAKRRDLPNGASCHTAQTAQRRKLPKSARCQTAATAPTSNGANCPTARGAKERKGRRRVQARPDSIGHRAAVTRWRPSAVRAVGQFAPSDVSAVVAVWHLAPSGSSRRMATRAVGQFALYGTSRRFAHPRAPFQRFAPFVHCAVWRTRARRFRGLRSSGLRRLAVRAFPAIVRVLLSFPHRRCPRN